MSEVVINQTRFIGTRPPFTEEEAKKILDKMVAMTPREHWREVVQRIRHGRKTRTAQG